MSNHVSDLMDDVETWLSPQAADFFDTGIQILIPRFSVPMVTMPRSSLSMYIFFTHNNLFPNCMLCYYIDK
jgi:hypothetical protein